MKRAGLPSDFLVENLRGEMSHQFKITEISNSVCAFIAMPAWSSADGATRHEPPFLSIELSLFMFLISASFFVL